MVITRGARHKTARQGAANVVMTEQDHSLIKKYVKRMRPKTDSNRRLDQLFVLAGLKQILNANIPAQEVGEILWHHSGDPNNPP